MGKRILHVTGFGRDTRARDLAHAFERYGRLVRCDIPAARRDSKPFAFVEFEDSRDAGDAFDRMHDQYVGDSRIAVQWAKRPPSRSWRFEAGSDERGGGRRGDDSRSRRSPSRSRSPPRRGDSRRSRHSPPPRRRSRSRSRSPPRDDTRRNGGGRRGSYDNDRRHAARRASPPRSPSPRRDARSPSPRSAYSRSPSRSRSPARAPPAAMDVDALPSARDDDDDAPAGDNNN
ncbi:hypothetical protein EV174_002794 [Coemansia sp. RSA 2320]|nr:hypothetical protein EV174_002794 [Coemansia sp. RSA 2320]